MIPLILSVLTGAVVGFMFLAASRWIAGYLDRQVKSRLETLLDPFRSSQDRGSVEKAARIAPWVSLILVILLLLFARSLMSVIVFLVAIVVTYKIPILVHRRLMNRRNEQIIARLPDAVNAIANSVKAGEPLPVAFGVVGEKFKPPISVVFGSIAERQRIGERFDEGLLEVARLLGLDPFNYFARAVALHIRQGGKAYEMLTDIKISLIEQDKCDRLIKATTAGGRFTMRFITFSPILMIPIISILQPDWASILLRNPVGIGITIVSVLLYLFGYQWAKQILSIEKI